MILGVGFEEGLFVLKGQGQSLKGLVQGLNQFSPLEQTSSFEAWLKLEQILYVVDLMLNKSLIIDPDAVFDKGEMRHLIRIDVETEPQVLIGVQLEDHLE